MTIKSDNKGTKPHFIIVRASTKTTTAAMGTACLGVKFRRGV
ncbi:hypothetical protein [Moraxella lacunata]